MTEAPVYVVHVNYKGKKAFTDMNKESNGNATDCCAETPPRAREHENMRINALLRALEDRDRNIENLGNIQVSTNKALRKLGEQYAQALIDGAIGDGVSRSLAASGKTNRAEIEQLNKRLEQAHKREAHANAETAKLAAFILDNFPGEPSFSASAVDCAIALLTRYKAVIAALGEAPQKPDPTRKNVD